MWDIDKETLIRKANDVDGSNQMKRALNWNQLSIPITIYYKVKDLTAPLLEQSPDQK